MACVYILQAAQTGMWPQPSITLGTGKPKSEPHPASKMGEIKPEEKIKQVRLDLFLVGFSHTSILFVLQVFCKVAQSIYYLEKAGSSACLTPPLPPHRTGKHFPVSYCCFLPCLIVTYCSVCRI